MVRKKLILVFILVLSFFFAINVYAEDFKITSYNVNINVNLDNSYDVTETIGVKYDVPKHGILRKIPVYSNVKSNDNNYLSYAKISNVKVNSSYTKYRFLNNYNIRIGSLFNKVSDNQKYVINYKYTLGKDKNKEFDEFYYNIIGTSWNTEINGVTFTIVMPKKFDKNKLGFSVGEYGNSSYDGGLKYNIIGNRIEGKYNYTLYNDEGITVRLKLNEGYFSKAKTNIDFYSIILIIIIIILIVLLVRYIKKKYKADYIEHRDFDIRELDSLECMYVYNEYTDSKSAKFLLFDLAYDGYIKIEKKLNGGVLSSNSFFIAHKVKDYDGNKDYEKVFMDELFKNDNDINLNENLYLLSSSSSSANLSLTLNFSDYVFDKRTVKLRWNLFKIIIVFQIITILIPLLKYTGDYDVNGSIIMFYIFAFVFGFYSKKDSFTGQVIFLLIDMLFMLAVGFSYINDGYLTLFIIFSIIYSFSLIMLLFVKRRTSYGNQGYDEVSKYKENLNKGNVTLKDIPYIFTLNVNKKVLKNFSSKPKWFICDNYSFNDLDDLIKIISQDR